MRPSAWSTRRKSSVGKRAANGARGLSSSAPTLLKPSRRSVARVSGASRNASIGKWRQRRGLLARGQNARRRLVKARQRPGRAGRVGDGEPRRQAEIFSQSCGKIGEQLLLAAEQMRRAGDVEEKTVGAVVLVPRRDGRRVARRPQGQPRSAASSAAGSASRTCRNPLLARASASRSPVARPTASAAAFKAAMRGPPWQRQRGRTDGPDQLACLMASSPAPRASAGSASAAARLKRCAT